MIKSLYSGVTGLKTHNQRMDVIGNNIANVNTTAYKAGTVTFKDVYYQTRQRASGGDFTQGGVNPMQIGFGTQLGTIGKVMTQSGLTYSDSVFDMALEGSGFFQVMDNAGNIFYTRLGRFSLDDFGNLTDPNGNIVLGVSGDPTGFAAGSQRINIQIPNIEDAYASVTREILGHNVTFTATAIGPGGNTALTLIHSETPFATQSGSVLNVYLNLRRDYEAEAILEVDGGTALTPAEIAALTPLERATRQQAILTAIQDMMSADIEESIRLGGVNLDEALRPIEIEFGSVPDVTAAQQANNHIILRGASGATTQYMLDFEVIVPGAAGNNRVVEIVSRANQSIVTAAWRNNVLTVTLPASGEFDMAQLQRAVEDAGRNPASAGEEYFGQPIITVNVSSSTDGGATWTAIDLGTAATPIPHQVLPGQVNVGGATQRVSMSGGADSFFEDAFRRLGTMRMEGGAFNTPQDPSTVDIFVDRDGVIYGTHPVHGLLLLGRVDIVEFINPEGLQQVGTSYFIETMASGPPQVRIPQEEADTFIISGALEMSNVDLSQEFSDMIITQRGFQANSRIITVSDSMLEELVNLKR
jgi:flagellar hook protein FlgE